MENTLSALVARAHAESQTRPDVGRVVVVVRGRKVPLGTSGIVRVNCLREIRKYGRVVARERRVGIEIPTSVELVWTAERNCEVVKG